MKRDTIVIKTDKHISNEEGKTQVDVTKERISKGISISIQEQQENNPHLITPITLPYSDKEVKAEEYERKNSISNKDVFELNEDEPFLIQFPRYLPYNLQHQVEMKNQELVVDENKEQANKDFKSSFTELSKLFQMGKFQIYKSGKMKLIIGENSFDVSQGMKNMFAQELMIEKNNQAFLLGKLKKEKLLVSPELS